jgi:hypothetical protein
LDLYLTLFLLGIAPTLPWWSQPLPGGLGDLDTGVIVSVMAVMYVAELVAERRPASYLAWNAVHACIRPVSGALLAALLLQGASAPFLLAGAVAGGLITLFTHVVRSGAAILRELDPKPDPSPGLVRILEDVVVVALVTASLDAPEIALVGGGVIALISLPRLASRARAFAFVAHLAAARVFQTFRQRRWIPEEELPEWVRDVLAADPLATGQGLRGSRAGMVDLRASRRFDTGWLVLADGRPVFVRGSATGIARLIDLGDLTARRIIEEDFHRALELECDDDRLVRLLFFVSAPSPAALAADFGLAAPSTPDAPQEKNL